MKTIGKSYDETLCGKCNSNNTQRYNGLSSWNFFIECKDCGTKHSYSVNDAMGCEGCNPFHLRYIGEDWDYDYKVDAIALKLQKAENGWVNENGRYYEQYDRLKYTAKKLIEEDGNISYSN